MIPVLFNILLFLIPLIFYKGTSELFEFNKIITVYIFTAVITSVWAIQMIAQKRLIFRRTILDWPLIIYLAIYLISSLISIDPRTSWLGYYSRFNGGLISQVCYALLYWAFVSNLNRSNAIQSIVYSLLSTAIASALAIGERYGIFTTCGLMGFGYHESCWVQDVQNRVFSTLGQPNWLAAILVALLPIIWSRTILESKILNLKSIVWPLVSMIFFIALLFTKSRSGLLAFGVSAIVFWGFVFLAERFKYLKEFIFIFLASSFLAFVFWFNLPLVTRNLPEAVPSGPALETGGTESGTIRKYVWLGAINIFKKYPILGSGPETFAFTFPIHKPIEHNLTSEWDFIYNKAHNEYLNLLATTGLLGFFSYVALIIVSIYQIGKNEDWKLRIGLLAGYIAILVTNFFGFSVVPVSLLFFLFPAMAVVQRDGITSRADNKVLSNKMKLDRNQVVGIIFVLCTMSYVLFCVAKYWQADTYYNKSRNLNREKSTTVALVEIDKALKNSPDEPNFIAEKALITGDINIAVMALDLNPYNQNIRNILINNLNLKASENKEYLLIAEEIAKTGTIVTPMNPKIFYQLSILNLKNNKVEDALSNLEKAVYLKPNYKEARFALGLTYIDVKNYERAKENLEYILKNIDPNDELTKKYLDQAKSASE